MSGLAQALPGEPGGQVCVRRARPGLGTLVEVGVQLPAAAAAQVGRAAALAIEEAWRALAEVERALSAFDPGSEIGRFNAAPAGACLPVGPDAQAVLRAAAAFSEESLGLFDVTQGTGRQDWSLSPEGLLRKRTLGVRLDLGGIGKGHAVDRALDALRAALCASPSRELGGAPCWVNAGGDLRVSGLDLLVALRDEEGGGARPWLLLRDGALATSWFGPGARSRLVGAGPRSARHVSVAAPDCLTCDALTKVVALSGPADAALLARHGATAWLHS